MEHTSLRQDLTSWQEPWEDANIVGANGGGRDERLREGGHIEVAISGNVREPVSLLCSMREFRGHSIYQRK